MTKSVPVKLAVLMIAVSAVNATRTTAADWSRFRGPNGSGVAHAGPAPVEFGPDKAVDWVTAVPPGRSSPVLTEERIFLTAIDEGALVTLALDRASGEIVWRRSFERDFEADLYHGTDSASSTPVTDGRNVYAFFHEGGLVSYGPDGTERWRRSLGSFRNFYGIAASPVLAGNVLLLVCDQAQGSFLVAVDADSGEELWRRERTGRVESYTTPILLPDAGSPEAVLLLGTRWIDAYDPTTGDLLWTLPGVGVGPVSSPTLDGDMLYVSAPDQASEPLPLFATVLAEHDGDDDGRLSRGELAGTWMEVHFGFLDIDGDGWLTADGWEALGAVMTNDDWGVFGLRLHGATAPPEIVWNIRQSVPYIPTPLAYDGVLYLVKKGIVSAVDPATGELHKRGRLAKTAEVNASPIAAGGRIYIATTDGNVAVIEPGPDWQILSLNDLGEAIHATPAVADGHLYVRTSNHLFSFVSADVSEAPPSTRP